MSLPDTGQTMCYDGAGRFVLCSSPTCPGQDGGHETAAQCPAEQRFADNGDGTVTDYCTGLMWQQDTADVNDDEVISPELDRLTWCEALDYCETLTHAGYEDWRLPNIRELLSLVDYGRINPAIDPLFSAASWGYWSSTTFTGFPDYAWSVVFDDGDDWGEVKGKLFGHVRAVRSY